MQYSLMFYQTPELFAARTDPARRAANQAAFGGFVGALQKAGVLVTTLGIEPPESGATVRAGGGTPRVETGPYADMKEQLGGLCVIETASLDAALDWARRAPFEHCGVVEVRPTRVVPAA
ncbi:MAG TPA: YciI family protein [Gemmatimonadaceae bacterium]|nr:YciI family protein [Gemmatimonadaceae bacterium]